jgi:hypothetical protein|tara:strand:- start:5860 stop:6081 length:222 start_codon:yes stop_codon:yes gene_type:complete
MNWISELSTPFNLWRSQYNINENINPCNENREYSNDIKNNKCENEEIKSNNNNKNINKNINKNNNPFKEPLLN